MLREDFTFLFRFFLPSTCDSKSKYVASSMMRLEDRNRGQDRTRNTGVIRLVVSDVSTKKNIIHHFITIRKRHAYCTSVTTSSSVFSPNLHTSTRNITTKIANPKNIRNRIETIFFFWEQKDIKIKSLILQGRGREGGEKGRKKRCTSKAIC